MDRASAPMSRRQRARRLVYVYMLALLPDEGIGQVADMLAELAASYPWLWRRRPAIAQMIASSGE